VKRFTQIRHNLNTGLMAGTVCAVLSACTAQPPNNASETYSDQSMAAPAETHAATPRAKSAPSAPQQAAIDPASLVGMTGARISALFGRPVFVRRDAPGEFWRYRGTSCVLELFFYPKGGAQRVDHIETRAGTGKALNRADCVAALRKAPAKG
jgi:hypothetical protein